MALEFRWDPRKAAKNIAKHGVGFDEAATVFGDALGQITDDPRHSGDEQRYVLLGQPERRNLPAVMFSERGDAIRLISARRATRREHNDYEKTKSRE